MVLGLSAFLLACDMGLVCKNELTTMKCFTNVYDGDKVPVVQSAVKVPRCPSWLLAKYSTEIAGQVAPR